MKQNFLIRRGSKNLRLCLDGIEWYTGIINNIINLINEQAKAEIIKTELEDFNKIISQAMVALQKDNYDYLADLLEVKVVEFIDRFIEINDELLSNKE